MTRAALFFLGIVVGVLLGAACVVLGFQLGQATAAVPSRPAPVVFQPLPRLDIGGVPAAVPPTRHLVDTGADQGDPVRRPTPEPTVVPSVAVLTPVAPVQGPGAPVQGLATWYSVGSGIYGAAGPALRVGHWRGRTVTVCAGTHCLVVVLSDWCACGDRPGGPTVIDLSRDAFARLAPPSRGLVEVTVTW